MADWSFDGARGARGSKKAMPHPPFYVLRALGPEDIEYLRSPPALRGDQIRPVGINQLRFTHHLLAQLLVEGKPQTECSQLTGYSPSYISIIKGDPAFRELLAHYTQIREETFVDTIARMRGLGLHTLEELQSRLAEEPGKWTKRELMELAELCLIKPMAATRGAVVPAHSVPGVNVSVNFVSPGDVSKTIEHEPAPTSTPAG
jgi:hypothetical protein